MTSRYARRWAASGVLSVFVTLLLPSCGHNVTQTRVTSVSVTGPSGSATVPGQTLPLAATANMSDGSTQNVTGVATWATSNSAVATVAGGVVTGVSVGDANISATHMNVAGLFSVGIRAVIARFTVANATAQNQCRIVMGSSGRLDCTFDGATSLGNPTQWTWRFRIANVTSDPLVQSVPAFVPNPGCGQFATKGTNQGNGSVQMIVLLTVRKGSVDSGEVQNQNVALFPQGQCGYGF